MEKPRHTLIVRDVAPRALFVAESNASLPDGMPVVAAQRREVERVNQVAERHVSLFAKLFGAFSNNLSPLCKPALGVVGSRQNASACQQEAHVGRNRRRRRFPSPWFPSPRFPKPKPRDRRFQPGT